MKGKVLLTGATGFIGAHLASALAERGYTVRGLVRDPARAEALRKLGVELCTGDVTLPETLRKAVTGVDAVYHLAGMVKAFNLKHFLTVNEQGVANIAQACAQRESPPTLLVVSSLAAAGPSLQGQPRTEEEPAAPASNYGRSKRAGEIAAERFAAQVPITVARPTAVFGENDPAMRTLFHIIRNRGIHAIPGMRRRYCSFVYVQDLVRGLIAAAESGKRITTEPTAKQSSSQGYYFFSDDAVRLELREIGRMVADVVGRKWLFVLPLPALLGWIVGGFCSGLARLKGSPSIVGIDKIREVLAGSWTCSSERARRELGFTIERPLAERMAQTAQWYIGQKWI